MFLVNEYIFLFTISGPEKNRLGSLKSDLSAFTDTAGQLEVLWHNMVQISLVGLFKGQ